MKSNDQQLLEEAYDLATLKAKLKEYEGPINNFQTALDVAGIEPSVGTVADGANVVVSALRAALADEKDERKRHLINAGISAISLIPFADVIKLLKLRKTKPVAKLAIRGARSLKSYGKQMHNANRFAEA